MSFKILESDHSQKNIFGKWLADPDRYTIHNAELRFLYEVIPSAEVF